MKLYSYFQSSGAYRVRIALALKGISVDMECIDLAKDAHRTQTYAAINPQQMIPSLITDDGTVLTQSLAIIEYLEERFPSPALLPLAPLERARVRALAHAMASDIGPLNNLRIRRFITQHFGGDEKEWIRHWTQTGLGPLERMLSISDETGRFCHGAQPTMADCVLVPQLAHARRFGCDLSAYPTLLRIDAACAEIPAFMSAHPSRQPDAI